MFDISEHTMSSTLEVRLYESDTCFCKRVNDRYEPNTGQSGVNPDGEVFANWSHLILDMTLLLLSQIAVY
jgi:hypothetical protein